MVAPIRVNRGKSSRRLRAAALTQHDVELEVFHGGVQDLLHRAGQAVDLVDEEHVAVGQVGEQGRQVSRSHKGRPRRNPVPGPHLVGNDAGQRGLAQTGRPGKEHVVCRLVSPPGRLQHDLQVFLQLRLADEL